MLINKYLKFIKSVKENIEHYKNTLGLEPSAPGYVLQVRQNKQLIYEDCYGVKDLKTKALINSDTVFLMAALAKPALANIIIENLSSFTELYVSKYIDCPFKNLTICHLIKHKSGLPNYLNLLNKTEINNMSLSELADVILSQELNFPVGKKIEYSASGYVVLAKIIESTFGGNYCELMESKYGHLNIDFNFSHQKHFASNYQNKGGVYKKVSHNNYITGWGDGLLYSSANEYTKMFNGELKYKQLLHVGDGEFGTYYYHLGGAPGVDSLFCYIEDMDLEVTLICNSSNNIRILSDLILESLEGKIKFEFQEL